MNKREPNWWEWEPGIEDGGVGRVLHVDALLIFGEADGLDIGNDDDSASRAHRARRTPARRKVEFDESDANRPVGVGCECREIPADCLPGEPCPDGRGGEVISAKWLGAREWLDDGETYDFCRLSVGCRDSSGKCDFWTRGKSDSSRGGCVHKYGSDVNSKSGYPQCYYDDEYRDGTGCCMCRFLCSNDDYTDYACVDEGGDSDGGEILTFYFDYDVAVLCEPWWKGWPDDDHGEDDGPPHGNEDGPGPTGPDLRGLPKAGSAKTPDGLPKSSGRGEQPDGSDGAPDGGDAPWNAQPEAQDAGAPSAAAGPGDHDDDGDCEVSVSSYPALGLFEGVQHLWVSVRTRDGLTLHWEGQPADCPMDWYPPAMAVSRTIGDCQLRGAAVRDDKSWRLNHPGTVTAPITPPDSRGACKEAARVNACIKSETDRINGASYAYRAFLGPNSNTYAHSIMNFCTATVDTPLAASEYPAWASPEYPL